MLRDDTGREHSPAPTQLIISPQFDPTGWQLPSSLCLRIAGADMLLETLAPARYGVPTVVVIDEQLSPEALVAAHVGEMSYRHPLRLLASFDRDLPDVCTPFWTPYTVGEHNRALVLAVRQVEAVTASLAQSEDNTIADARFAELGRLAGGIIHELNNPLAFSRNNLMLVRERLAAGVLRLLATAWSTAGSGPEAITELLQHLDRLPSRASDVAELRRELAQTPASGRVELVTDFLTYLEAHEQECVGTVVDALKSAEPLLHDSIRGLERMTEIVAGVRRLNRPHLPGEFPVDIDRTIRETLAVLRDRARARQITLRVKPRLHQHYPCDSTTIAHIVSAVLTRVIEAVPLGSEVLVSSREVRGQIEIAIDRPASSSEGLDELLAGTVCHRLARQLGGALVLEQLEGVRTIICLKVPLRRLQSAASGERFSGTSGRVDSSG